MSLRLLRYVGLRRYATEAMKVTNAFNNKDRTFPDTHSRELSNGFKVVAEEWNSPMCAVGVFMDIGSRYDTDATAGISHFLEHLAFKGTGKRSGKQIVTECLERGITLNASTSRELSSVRATCQPKHLAYVMELLGDVVKNDKFDAQTVDAERNAIMAELDEIETNNYKQVVFDYLHATAYQGTPLSRSIYGDTNVICGVTPDQLSAFVNAHYKAPRMVLSVAGGVSANEVDSLAEKHFSDVSATYDQSAIPPRLPVRFTGSELRDRDDAMPLAHICIAVEGPGWESDETIALWVASQLNPPSDRQTGGAGYVASKLAPRIYYKGIIHSYENFYQIYHDTSLWGMYYTSERMELDYMTEFLLDEWMRICLQAREFEVERAKNQLRMSLLQRTESTKAQCNDMGREMLVYGRRMPIKELICLIDKVKAKDVRDVYMKYVYNKDPAVSSLGPNEALLDYNRIRSNMYRLRV